MHINSISSLYHRKLQSSSLHFHSLPSDLNTELRSASILQQKRMYSSRRKKATNQKWKKPNQPHQPKDRKLKKQKHHTSANKKTAADSFPHKLPCENLHVADGLRYQLRIGHSKIYGWVVHGLTAGELTESNTNGRSELAFNEIKNDLLIQPFKGWLGRTAQTLRELEQSNSEIQEYMQKFWYSLKNKESLAHARELWKVQFVRHGLQEDTPVVKNHRINPEKEATISDYWKTTLQAAIPLIEKKYKTEDGRSQCKLDQIIEEAKIKSGDEVSSEQFRQILSDGLQKDVECEYQNNGIHEVLILYDQCVEMVNHPQTKIPKRKSKFKYEVSLID